MESRVVKKPREPKGVRNKKTLTPWNGVVDNPDDYEGFVYCITRNDGKYYVGMKFTKSRRRVKPHHLRGAAPPRSNPYHSPPLTRPCALPYVVAAGRPTGLPLRTPTAR